MLIAGEYAAGSPDLSVTMTEMAVLAQPAPSRGDPEPMHGCAGSGRRE